MSNPTRPAGRKAVLDAAAVQALMATNPDVLLVDVRTSGEYGTAHVPGSVNLPLDQVDAHLRRIVTDAGGSLVLVCQAGGRASQAHERLTAAGLTDVAVLEGGMNAWVAAGGPVERAGAARWALERQVRLVAGTLVLVAVLGSIVVPGLHFVAGAVGAGLALAAITDSCLMGMLLARLPYNRGPGADVEAAIARMADPARAGDR
jgi:rhodanese-related sulfurtransferase